MTSPNPNRSLQLRAYWGSGAARAAIELALAIGILACSTDHRTEQERAADQSLADQVHDALRADTNLYAAHIGVDAKNGVVWLTGFVTSAEQARAASRDVRSVSGVRSVVDQIEIDDWMPHR